MLIFKPMYLSIIQIYTRLFVVFNDFKANSIILFKVLDSSG